MALPRSLNSPMKAKRIHLGRFIALLLLASAPAPADLIRSINEARADGCDGRPGVATPLRSNAKLGQAAQRLQSGQKLREAMESVNYYGIKSSSVHMSGRLSDAAVARTLSNRFCNSLADT